MEDLKWGGELVGEHLRSLLLLVVLLQFRKVLSLEKIKNVNAGI